MARVGALLHSLEEMIYIWNIKVWARLALYIIFGGFLNIFDSKECAFTTLEILTNIIYILVTMSNSKITEHFSVIKKSHSKLGLKDEKSIDF